MRQVLGPGALGRPRGIGWRGMWEGGIRMGSKKKKRKEKKFLKKKKKNFNLAKKNIHIYLGISLELFQSV